MFSRTSAAVARAVVSPTTATSTRQFGRSHGGRWAAAASTAMTSSSPVVGGSGSSTSLFAPTAAAAVTSPLFSKNRHAVVSSPAAPLHFGAVQRRSLHLFEFQSKQLLRDNGVHVQRGDVAETADEAFAVAKKLKDEGAKDLIVKCQVLAGGRGKGRLTSGLQGGVKICSTPEEVKEMASQMLGYRLITHQTTEEGEFVKRILIHEGVDITKELYLAVVIDTKLGGPAIVASQMGGVDIEEVSQSNPDAIKVIKVSSPENGLSREEGRKVAEALGFDTSECAYPLNVTDQLERLVQLFKKTDATMVEVNPLAVTTMAPDFLVAVDAKFTFDDAAKFRQEKLFSLEEEAEGRDLMEKKAEEVGLNFVKVDGTIGCLVNGAGLAMATMDAIKLHGGSPANFLDVGGGATVPQVSEAMKLLQSDNSVKALFVNVFGGIMRCDVIAEGLVEAVRNVGLSMPLVVRLCGNRVDEGRAILEKSGINCEFVEDFDMAAKRACVLGGSAA